MNILFLTQNYKPEVRTAPQNLAALAEDLSLKGHSVTAITAFPNHPFGEIYDGYKMKIWQFENLNDVNVIRLPLYPDHSMSAMKRTLNYSSFSAASAILGSMLTNNLNFDVIFAYLPPLFIGLPAFLLKQIHRAPIVYWMTDLWPENILSTGINLHSISYKSVRVMENWVYKNSMYICLNSPGFIGNLKEKGVDEKKLRVIPDWADEDIFYPAELDNKLGDKHNLNEKFNVIYGGNIGKVQGLETIVDAASLLQNYTNIQFVFIGDGTELEILKSYVREQSLKNVKFIPRQPMEEIHKFFAFGNLLLAHLNSNPIFKLQTPSKIIAYMACGKPVLCAIEGVSGKIITENDAGFSCSPEDPEALADEVIKAYKMDNNLLHEMGENGRELFLSNYTRKVQVNRFEAILKKAAVEY